MTACPVGGVSVTIIVTVVADSGMYFDTLTSIGVGSTGASGGTSACATCTKAGGGCISMVWFPVTLAGLPSSTLARRQDQFFRAFYSRDSRNCWRLEFAAAIEISSKTRKRGTHRVPLHPIFAGAQKLNVMPVVAALMVAPPMVSLAASREQ